MNNNKYTMFHQFNIKQIDEFLNSYIEKYNNSLLIGDFLDSKNNILYNTFQRTYNKENSENTNFIFLSKNNMNNLKINKDCFNVNIFEIPKDIYPQLWVDTIIELFSKTFNLKDITIYLFSNIINSLYREYNVFFAKTEQEIKNRSSKITFLKISERIEKVLLLYKRLRFSMNVDDYDEEITALTILKRIFNDNFSDLLKNTIKYNNIDYFITNNCLFLIKDNINNYLYNFISACYIETLINKQMKQITINKNKKLFIYINNFDIDYPITETFKRAYNFENVFFFSKIDKSDYIPNFMIEKSNEFLLGRLKIHNKKILFNFLNKFNFEKDYSNKTYYSNNYNKKNINRYLVKLPNDLYLYCNKNYEMSFIKNN